MPDENADWIKKELGASGMKTESPRSTYTERKILDSDVVAKLIIAAAVLLGALIYKVFNGEIKF